jgi:multicomponent Na+:H+ antiporter subunit G
MLEMIAGYISWIFLLLGGFSMVTGAMGILRMPDFYTRLHPAGLIDSLGAPLLLIGVILQNGFTLFSLKIVLLILFLMLTNSTATHVIAKSAMISGLAAWTKNKKE